MKKFRMLMTLILFFCVVTLTAGKPAKYVFLLIGDGSQAESYKKLVRSSRI